MSEADVVVTISFDMTGFEDALARMAALIADLPPWFHTFALTGRRTTFVMAQARRAQRLNRNAPRRLQRLLRGRPERLTR